MDDADECRLDHRLERLKAELLSPRERAALEDQYGKALGPLIDAKLEAKAQELLQRQAKSIRSIYHALVADMTNRDQLLVSREEAAQLLNISLSTLKRMEERGELPKPQKFGERIVRHRLIDIEAIAKVRLAVVPED
jgi:excisionase family DNA binding protein